VLRARFNDARFFWEFDQRVPLMERMRLLEKVTFQKDLGSYAAKTERVHSLAKRLTGLVVSRGVKVDAEAVEGAALLAKTDLTTELVNEFTELQGVVGGLYARAQGLKRAVAEAIYDQYLPASATDALPRSVEGSLLGLADRVDMLTGMFGLGLEPTGSKDPFALRRAANAVVRLLAETDLPLGLDEVLESTEPSQVLAARLRLFFSERVDFYLREVRGQAYDVAKAVMVSGYDDLRDLVARAEAVSAIRSGAEAATFAAVAAAFKRMQNILQQAVDRGLLESPVEMPAQVQMHPAQAALIQAANGVGEQFERLTAKRDYGSALELIATLRTPIDAFFEQVMVMDDDPYVRESRLMLLGSIVKTFSSIADFSEIVVAG
jgi:glycyl-tRNA synthetase beta chain